VVKPYWTQVLSWSSLVHPLWLKMTGVPLTLIKCTPWVLVIIDPCPCSFACDFERLSFIYFAESWMLKLTHTEACLPTSMTQFGWSLIDSPNPLASYRQHPIQRPKVCWNLYCSRAMLARGSEDDYFWSRVVVCRSLLEATTRVPRDSLDAQFSISPADGWPNWASKPNSKRYSQSLCDGIS
jgi:hypothetical protein